ncbi:MAG: polysaccharide pyruvyl transferase family protein [Chlorobium sp.]|nr:polysaccharide pyruvyl transferase family protein [Chlorobium sp.]
MNISLFNPALKDNQGNPSINLGDLIIGARVTEILKEIFPDAILREFSTHAMPLEDEIEWIQQADLILVGGTNLLSSSVQEYNQWKLGATPQIYLTPPLAEAVLCGVGWWQYQDKADTVSKHFYRQLLSSSTPHSVRDSYTARKMREMGMDNVINTSCPTLWNLDGYKNIRTNFHKKCLTCFTDYRPDQEANNALLEILLAHYPDGITIFPQGDHDIRDMSNLKTFIDHQDRIELLPHDISLFFQRVAQNDADYVGTRLHAGAYCMTHGLDSLIIGVDNRSVEISKDISLPVVDRNDFQSIKEWLEGKRIFDPVKIPLQGIEEWKEALRDKVKGSESKNRSLRQGDIGSGQPNASSRMNLLNLGCGGRYHPAWTNVDYIQTGPGVLAQDLMQPFEFSDNTFDAVYHSHVLEHMPKRYAPDFLRECLRILKPGGILRVVVPDLELAAHDYLQQLNKAKNGDRKEIDKLEYLTINLLDQMTRHCPGGELLNYWKQNPMPVEEFAVEMHGLELVRSLAVLRDPGAPEEYRAMQTSFNPSVEHSAEKIGQFRISGEAHLWMYDQVSLKELLLDSGFSSVKLCQADESRIPDFNAYHLDIMNDGSTAKPDSLFMEGTKP